MVLKEEARWSPLFLNGNLGYNTNRDERGYRVKLSKRQEQIAQIVREEGPVTGSAIAEHLEVTRSALRSDLSVLTMLGVLDARPNVGYYYVGLSKETQTAERLKSFLVSDVLSQAVVVNGDTSLYDTIVTIFTEDVGTYSSV